MSGFLGCGTVYFDRKVDGIYQGYKRLGNATKLEIKENAELKERVSKQCDTYGQTIDSVTIKQPAEFSAAMDDLDAENMALAFLGKVEDRSVVAGTVTGESQTAVTLGAMIQTDKANISALVITDVTDTTTYAENTDYKIVNAAVGLVEILSTGSIVAGDVLHLGYTNGAVTSKTITGGTDSNLKVRILMVGKNLADQSNVQVKAWEVSLTPQSGVDFLAEDFTSIDIGGTLNLDEAKGNAYEVDTQVVNA